MEVKITTTTATTHFHFRQSGCSQTFASTISLFDQRGRSPSSSSKKSLSGSGEAAELVCSGVLGRSSLLGGTPARLSRSQSCDQLSSRPKPLRRSCRSCRASLDSFSEDDFLKNLGEFALGFDRYCDGNATAGAKTSSLHETSTYYNRRSTPRPSPIRKFDSVVTPPWVEEFCPLDCPRPEMAMLPDNGRKFEEMILPSIQMGKKEEVEEEVEDGGLSESVYSSMKAAFSSMVFMIREIQSCSLQIRQALFGEDLRQILGVVQRELHASFVWIFQKVFSCTPTLMVYVMILLANFTVYSMTHNTALAAAPRSLPDAATSLGVVVENNPPVLSFKEISVSAGKMLPIGGGMGGGGVGRSPPVAGGTDEGDGLFQRDHLFDASAFSSFTGNQTASDRGGSAWEEEDLWRSIVQEAAMMQAAHRADALDLDTVHALVAPVVAKIESEDTTAYFRTQLVYQKAIENDPHNPLLLSNYAQFLYLVLHDHDRAEQCFQRAARVVPPDAEALSRYANFLWLARKDIAVAEETFLEALAAEPGNTFYAANYAHFLWNTGGEDTCFPLEDDV